MNIQRIDDSSYLFRYEDQNESKDVILTISNKIGTSEFRYNLAQIAAEILTNGLHSEKELKKAANTFTAADKKWKYEKKQKTNLKMRMASEVTNFIHKQGEDNVLRFKVTMVDKMKKKDAKFEKAMEALNFNEHLKLNANMLYAAREVIEPQELEEGIRGKENLEEMYYIDSKPFSDPYTKLATLAFQHYEKNFTSKDNFKPEDCQYCIVKIRDQLKLVNKDNKKLNDMDRNRNTIDAYTTHLIKEYGKEKIEYIQHLYGIDFDKISILTPEHIYRINVGLSNIEDRDLNKFLAKLPDLDKQLSKATNDDLSLSLDEIYKRKKGPLSNLTGQEIKGIYRLLQSNKPPGQVTTLGDVKAWVKTMRPHSKTIDKLSPQEFNKIMSIFKINSEEMESALTGRKIYDYLHSGYTSAELGEYKPWVDQHELLQVMPELKASRSQMHYQEVLAHVVAKNHLAREHPIEGYRVGALIPATLAPNGEERWFKVTSCCNNGHGIFSYTLEPACNDPSINSIKLYRSTASAAYAMDKSASVLNDFNSLNSPGYEGMGREIP